MIEFTDIKDFKYTLNNLADVKLGGKYVTAFDAKECRNAVMCLNCNKRGHFIQNCPNSIVYSETVDEKSMSRPGHRVGHSRGGHSRGITIYEPKIPSELRFETSSVLTLNNNENTDTDEQPLRKTKSYNEYPKQIMLNTSTACYSDSNSDGVEIERNLLSNIRTKTKISRPQTHSFMHRSAKIQISNLPQLRLSKSPK